MKSQNPQTDSQALTVEDPAVPPFEPDEELIGHIERGQRRDDKQAKAR